jgi:hypothetical protein
MSIAVRTKQTTYERDLAPTRYAFGGLVASRLRVEEGCITASGRYTKSWCRRLLDGMPNVSGWPHELVSSMEFCLFYASKLINFQTHA